MVRSFTTFTLLAGCALAAQAGAQQDTAVRTTTVITTTKIPVSTTSSTTGTPEQRTAAALNSRTRVPLIIPEGTPLKVQVDRAVSSASVNEGDTVTFRMAADYSQYGHVLISKGTKVRGNVTNVERRSAGGQPGKLTISVESVRTVDGQHVPIEGTKSVTGKNRETQATTLGILTLGLGATKKGLSATIPDGYELTVYTMTPVTVVVPR